MWLEKKVLDHLSEGKVRFLPERCIRVKNRFASCDKCWAVCPAGAIAMREDLPLFERDKCRECMQCAAHCPSGAFCAAEAPRIEREIFQAKALVFCCERMAAREDAVVFTCLRAVTTQHFLLGVLAHGFVRVGYSAAHCRGCKKNGGAVLEELKAKALRAERLLKDGARVEIVPPEELRRDAPRYSRREIFLLLKEKAKAGLAGLISEEKKPVNLRGSITAENGAALFWRLYERFPAAFSAKALPEDLPCQLLAFGKACSGCGVCAKVCPAAALSFRREGGGVQLAQDLRRCIGCGSCRDICPQRALIPAVLPEISLSERVWRIGMLQMEEIGILDFI